MCIATAALAATAITAGGQLMNGIAQGNAAAYQGKVANNNAIIARQNAAYAASAGAAQTEQAGLKARNQQANLRASEAVEGVDVNSGSAAEVQTGQRMIGGLDQATVSNNAALESYGYQSQATSYEAQAKLDHAEMGYDYLAGGVNAAGTIAGSPQSMQFLSSQLSGNPSVPPEYSWMQSGDASDANVGFG